MMNVSIPVESPWFSKMGVVPLWKLIWFDLINFFHISHKKSSIMIWSGFMEDFYVLFLIFIIIIIIKDVAALELSSKRFLAFK